MEVKFSTTTPSVNKTSTPLARSNSPSMMTVFRSVPRSVNPGVLIFTDSRYTPGDTKTRSPGFEASTAA